LNDTYQLVYGDRLIVDDKSGHYPRI